jgi:FK506-binding nuclear protein
MFRHLSIPVLVLASFAVAQPASTQPSVQIKQLAPAKPGAQDGDTLFVFYTGKLQNGTVFDSNVGGRLFSFVLGTGQVIKGWDQGMQGMQIGEKRELIIPPDLAYGAKGNARIPANSTLDFTVELIGLARVPK